MKWLSKKKPGCFNEDNVTKSGYRSYYCCIYSYLRSSSILHHWVLGIVTLISQLREESCAYDIMFCVFLVFGFYFRVWL